MRQPHYITSKRLEDILEQQFGLYHRANRSHVWNLSDLLKQQYDVNILYRIYEAGPISDVSLYPKPYIPIAGATVGINMYNNPLLHIPEKNFDGCCSWYITNTAQWILWVQSAQDTGKVWAWQMHLDAPNGITALNDEIHQGGWRIPPTNALRSHIAVWEEICDKTHEAEERDRFTRQFPVMTHHAFDTRGGYTVTQRMPNFAVDWPSKYPELDKMEDQIMQQLINSHRIDQTNM